MLLLSNGDLLPVKSDVVFRLFFADERNEDSLISFLKSVLRLPDDDYNEIEIADPHLLREYDGDKLAIIDVKLKTKTKKIIHIEIQLKVTPELKNRIILDLYERREKARRDQSSRERWAAKQQALEIAKNAIKMKLPIDDIITLTGLTREEVEGINDTD